MLLGGQAKKMGFVGGEKGGTTGTADHHHHHHHHPRHHHNPYGSNWRKGNVSLQALTRTIFYGLVVVCALCTYFVSNRMLLAPHTQSLTLKQFEAGLASTFRGGGGGDEDEDEEDETANRIFVAAIVSTNHDGTSLLPARTRVSRVVDEFAATFLHSMELLRRPRRRFRGAPLLATSVSVSIYHEGGAMEHSSVLEKKVCHELRKVGTSCVVHFVATTPASQRQDRAAAAATAEGEELSHLRIVTRHMVRVRNTVLGPFYLHEDSFHDVVLMDDAEELYPELVHYLARVRGPYGASVLCGVYYNTNEDDLPRVTNESMVVNRDIMGHKFDESRLAHLPSGTPHPVASCWGSVVIVDPKVFTVERLRFRNSLPFECEMSEHQLINRDLWALGRARILLLPLSPPLPIQSSSSSSSSATSFASATSASRMLSSTTSSSSSVASFEIQPAVTASAMAVAPRLHHRLPNPYDVTIHYAVEPPKAMECCETHADRIEINWESCFMHDMWLDMFQRMERIPRATRSHGSNAVLELSPGVALDDAITIDDYSALWKRHKPCPQTSWGNINIPNRVVQIGRYRQVRAINFRILQGMLSWIVQDECTKYDFYDDDDIAVLLQQLGDDRYEKAYNKLGNGGERADLIRYLIMHREGGIYADTDTYAISPLSKWILPDDEFVVGLEASFKSDRTSQEWVYARQKSASLHAFAASVGSPILQRVIETVVGNIENPIKVYAEIRRRKIGAGAHLDTIFKTGPGPFSDAVFAYGSRARVLPVMALSGSHSQGQRFFDLQTEDSKRDTTVFVKHLNFGSWLKPHPFIVKNGDLSVLRSDRDLLQKEWIISDTEDVANKKVLACVDGHREPGVQPSEDMYLTLTENGVVEVLNGLGPRDRSSQRVMYLDEPTLPPDRSSYALSLKLEHDGRLFLNLYSHNTYVPQTLLVLSGVNDTDVSADGYVMAVERNASLCVYRN